MTATRVAIVAFDQIRPFHLAVPCAVFGEPSGAEPLFDVRVCAAEPGELGIEAVHQDAKLLGPGPPGRRQAKCGR